MHKNIAPNRVEVEEFITGCAMFVRCSAVSGEPLDNRFFAYFEDAAMSKKMAERGYKNVIVPAAVIYHKLSASSDRKGAFYTYLISRNRILFVNNYFPGPYRLYFLVFNLVKLALVVTYFLAQRDWTRLHAYTRGYKDGMKGKYGKPSADGVL